MRAPGVARGLVGTAFVVGLGLTAFGCGPALTVGGILGIDALDKDDDDVNAPPALSVTTPSGVVGDVVAISYRLSDAEGDRASVTVEYDVGAGFQPATAALSSESEGTTNLETSAAGSDHTFLWAASADLGFVNQTSPQVTVRITPRDANTGAQGKAASTDPFSVFNEYMATLAKRPTEVGVLPFDIDLAADGSLLLADAPGNRVVRVDGANGKTSVLAGSGEAGFNGDGLPGAETQLNFPMAVSGRADGSGDVLVADSGNARVRNVDGLSGFVTTAVGSDDDPSEPAVAAQAESVAFDLALDGQGVLFLAEESRVRAANLVQTSSVSFPTGGTNCPSPWGDPLFPVTLGNILTVINTGCTPAGMSNPKSALLHVPDEIVAVASWGSSSSDPRFLYLLEIGPQGGAPSFLATGTWPRLVVVNYSSGPQDFVVAGSGAGSPTSVAPGERLVLMDQTTTPPMPVLGQLSDLSLLGDRLIVFSGRVRKGLVYAFNASTAPATVLEATVQPGQRLSVAGQADQAGYVGDGLKPSQAQIGGPLCLVADPSTGAIYCGEDSNRVRVLVGPTPVSKGGQSFAANTVGSLAVVPPKVTPGLVSPLVVRPAPGGDLFVTDFEPSDPRSNRVFRVDQRTAAVAPEVGSGVFGETGDGGPATDARLGAVIVPAVNPQGTLLLLADRQHHRVRAVNLASTPQTFLGVTLAPGAIDTVVGTGTPSPDPMNVGDGGPAGSATLNNPLLATFDASGLLWISDAGNHRVRVANPLGATVVVGGVSIAPGTIQTVVGDGNEGTLATAGDGGPGTSARLKNPGALPLSDGLIYISDGDEPTAPEPRIRVFNPTGATVTVAGVSIAPGNIDTIAGSGALRDPSGNNLGDGGPALNATFREFGGLALRSDGLLFVADPKDHRIRVVNTAPNEVVLGGKSLSPGYIYTLFGTGLPGFSGEVVEAATGFFSSTNPGSLDEPGGLLAFDDGRLFFCERGNGALRMANLGSSTARFGGVSAASGQAVIVAGSRSGKVRLEDPASVAVASDERIFFSDRGLFGNDFRVKLVDPRKRVVTVVAGNDGSGPPPPNLGDGGPAVLASLNGVEGIAVDPQGALYVCDAGSQRIRVVNTTTNPLSPAQGLTVSPGTIETVVDGSAGDGDVSNDDGATLTGSAVLDLVYPLQASRAGSTLWILDVGDRILRANTATGRIEGVYSPPSGLATAIVGVDADAAFIALEGMAAGSPGAQIHELRYDPMTSSFSLSLPEAGSGNVGWNGDRLPRTSMNLDQVRGLAFDATANVLFVADTVNHRVVAVNRNGTGSVTIARLSVSAGEARTIAGGGQGNGGFNGDAIPPHIALVNFPLGLALSPDGGLVFVDSGNGRLRRFQR
ncbi:MAG: hypothetical protein D6731_20940 [Planctomycetota bacterium]|nr:MAG: hypothetical protein D6731_20940 [Planctomycetota bacterium]